MPFFGLLSFLLWSLPESSGAVEWCQCPSSGFSHFYHSISLRRIRIVCVSMPFFGLLSFLRMTELNAEARKDCVNALLRASFFSTLLHQRFEEIQVMCQCPSSGFFLFYSPLWSPPIYKPSRPHFRK